MTTTNPPVANTRTWVSQYMSGYRCNHSAAVPTSSGSPLPVSQAEMKDQILQKFKHTTFTVDLTAQRAPCKLT